jgi:hypothetical protein
MLQGHVLPISGRYWRHAIQHNNTQHHNKKATLSLTALSIAMKNSTPSIMRMNNVCCYAECRFCY